jgi:hypothetical protein
MNAYSDKGITVAWRGNNALPHTHGMDVISRNYIETEGLPFVDTRAIEEYFKDDIATGWYHNCSWTPMEGQCWKNHNLQFLSGGQCRLPKKAFTLQYFAK